MQTDSPSSCTKQETPFKLLLVPYVTYEKACSDTIAFLGVNVKIKARDGLIGWRAVLRGKNADAIYSLIQ